jgi:hypothetical protein
MPPSTPVSNHHARDHSPADEWAPLLGGEQCRARLKLSMSVFTGGVGAVSGMPSRPVEVCPEDFTGRVQDGKLAVRPVNGMPLTAVNGLAFVTRSPECKNAPSSPWEAS